MCDDLLLNLHLAISCAPVQLKLPCKYATIARRRLLAWEVLRAKKPTCPACVRKARVGAKARLKDVPHGTLRQIWNLCPHPVRFDIDNFGKRSNFYLANYRSASKCL